MSTAEALTNRVLFNDDYDERKLAYDPAFGFMYDEVSRSDEAVTLLGFASPVTQSGEFDSEDTVVPIVNFADLAASERTVDKQGKGVGLRVYNTHQGLRGLAQLPAATALYEFRVNREKVLDLRRDQGSKIDRIAQHAGRILQTKLTGLEHVVEKIHESYGDSDVVLMTQPPRAELRQRVERNAPNPDGVVGEFMIIRNAAIHLKKIGIVV